jgi:hypothetical protein
MECAAPNSQSHLLKVPLAIVERADLARLQPPRNAAKFRKWNKHKETTILIPFDYADSIRDAERKQNNPPKTGPVKVEGVIAHAPRDRAVLARARRLVCLALDAVHRRKFKQ